MEPNPHNLRALSQQIGFTMEIDKQKREMATKHLLSAEDKSGFLLCLLKLLTEPGIPDNIRLSASIYFKNCVKKHWVPDTEKEFIPQSDRAVIKQHIVSFMLNMPKPIQKQLSQALAVISTTDFPGKWKSLLPELVAKLETDQTNVLIGVLETALSIFDRYRFEVKSQKLWEEIKYVLDTFQVSFLKVFQKICSRVQQVEQDKNAVKEVFKILALIAKIFYALNAQDIPEFFEDHMKDWMEPFQHFLKYKNPLLDPDTNSEPGLLDELQAAICDATTLYTNKYEEQFTSWVPKFVETTWALLSSLGEQERYDQLVTTAIRFLTQVAKKSWHKKLFSDEKTLQQICEKIVVPQLKLRATDIELFEDNGLEYIRRDMEGSDVDTRRRTTVDFVKGLCEYFRPQVSQILSGYLTTLLQEYSKNPATNWIHKDAGMYIVLALSVTVCTRRDGVKEVSKHFDIINFFATQVLPELQVDGKQRQQNLSILKADCLKFVAHFRQLLPQGSYVQIIPLCMNFLSSNEFVIHTYAASSIERLLSVRQNGKPRFSKEQLKPFVESLLISLFQILEKEESKENDYVLKSIMRVCAVAEETVIPYAPVLLQKITQILSAVSRNPRNPSFNHYLFETLACLIRYICKVNRSMVQEFEKNLFGPFQAMLSMETCPEFGPYVFQIMSQLLELRPDISPAYRAIYPSLLAPALWNTNGNIPAITRLLQAFLMKDSSIALQDSRFGGLLGIFQKLNASIKWDKYGLELLGIIIETIPLSEFGKYLGEMLKLLFSRLQKRKTVQFVTSLIVFYSRFVWKHGGDALIQAMDSVQPNIFGMFLNNIWLGNCQSISGKYQRKACSLGMINLLCKCPNMLKEPYIGIWVKILKGVVDIFEAPQTKSKLEDDKDIMEAMETGFNTSYTPLHFAPAPVYDPIAQVLPKEYLAKSLSALSSQHPGKFTGLVSQLPPDHQKALQMYMQQCNVRLQ